MVCVEKNPHLATEVLLCVDCCGVWGSVFPKAGCNLVNPLVHTLIILHTHTQHLVWIFTIMEHTNFGDLFYYDYYLICHVADTSK